MSNKPKTKSRQSEWREAAERRQGSSSRQGWIIGGIVFVIVVVVAATVFLTGKDDAATDKAAQAGVNAGTQVWGTVKVTGAPLPQFPSGQGLPDPGVGATVPALDGQKFDGSPIAIPTAGKPKVVMFLAHWCGHCQAEVPYLRDNYFEPNGLPADVDLFSVSTSVQETSPNYPPTQWLQKEEWPVPTMADDSQGTAGKAYGLSGFPYFVAVGADGKVVQRASGELTTDQFTALLDAARKGSPA